jgi:hypothetical protein
VVRACDALHWPSSGATPDVSIATSAAGVDELHRPSSVGGSVTPVASSSGSGALHESSLRFGAASAVDHPISTASGSARAELSNRSSAIELGSTTTGPLL